jgi:hypothetical protein
MRVLSFSSPSGRRDHRRFLLRYFFRSSLWIGVASADDRSAVLLENLSPAILGVAQNRGHELACSVVRRAGCVRLNIVRVFAVLFLMLAAEGRLTGPFPYSAAWGDIITGIVAVPVLWLLKGGNARYTTAIAAWNLFGAADLVLAIAFGITSAEGSPLQLFPGPGSEAMQHAPWSFVPTVLVPIWLILHAIIAVRLLRAHCELDRRLWRL